MFPPNIYSYDINRTQLIQLTSGETVDRFPKWSPSGQYVAFLCQILNEPNMPGWINLNDVSNGTIYQLPKEPETSYRLGRYCFSPDSTHIRVSAFRDEVNFLRVIAIENLSIVLDFHEENLRGGAFWDNRQFACIGKEELLIVSIETGKITKRISLNNSVQETLRGPAFSINYKDQTAFFIGTDSGIYQSNMESKCYLIQKQQINDSPVFLSDEYRISSQDGRSIPVHHHVPQNAKELGVLVVFGGPGEVISSDETIIQQLLQKGYEVIAPCYRGCSGYGQEHRNANIGDYGGGDVSDVLASGFDWKNRTRYKRPLAIVGFSYGGYLTLLAMARDDNPWDCGISLWAVTKIEHLGFHLPRAYPKDPIGKARAMVERNPVEQSFRIRIPLLILHGGNDTTSTDGEVRAIHQNINSNGTLCRLEIFDNDTHGLTKHRKEMFNYLFEYLETF